MFDLNTFGAIAEVRSTEKETSLYELAVADVDVTSFDFMDTDERRGEIEEAGLDPDDYAFD